MGFSMHPWGQGGGSGAANPAGHLTLEHVALMIRRALNCVDPRLVDHGRRVAAVFDAMLAVSGAFDERERRVLYLVALLHDIGAYRTEEIDRLVAFETDDVWEHSFYGYLFFKELSPLDAYAEVVLYHHMPDDRFVGQDARVRFLSQCLHVADRVDVLLLGQAEGSASEVARGLASAPPGQFAPEVIELFWQAERRFGLVDGLQDTEEPACLHAAPADAREAVMAASCLDMLVHVIDFRSRHTVTHTVTTAWVAYELAHRMLDDEALAKRVYFSALLHDLGKIGTPLAVLEKPGRLDAEEMAVMRTHVSLTESIIAGCVDEDIVRMASRHHEKLDGSGYPYGLRGSELTLPERIVAVADMVSALVGTRSYKEAYPKEKVVGLMAAHSEAGRIDAAVVDVMVRHYDATMEVVAEAARPVAEAYRRVQEGFGWLKDELEKSLAAAATG